MFGFHDPFEMMGAIMPLLVVMGFFAVVIVRIVQGGRQRELEIKSRITAMEHNLPVEPFPTSQLSRPNTFMMPLGIVFVCTGLGLAVALAFAGSGNEAVWGIMPISAGVGLIIAARLNQGVRGLKDEFGHNSQPGRMD